MSNNDIPVPTSRDEEIDQLAEAIAASLRLEREVASGPAASSEADASSSAAVASPVAAAAAAEPAAAAECAAPSGSGSEPEPAPESVEWLPRPVGRAYLEGLAARPKTDFRVYAVWSLNRSSGDRHWAGVHAGLDRDCYSGLLLLNGGSFGGLSWKRVHTGVAAAVSLWEAEALRKGIKHSARFYFWDPKPPSAWDRAWS